MSKSQTLRALVSERLTAAAEEIFALVERTIAEYEEELCRSKEENLRKQQIRDAQVQTSPETDVEVKEDPDEAVELPEYTAICERGENQRRHKHRDATPRLDCRKEPDTPHLGGEMSEFSGSSQQMETEPDGNVDDPSPTDKRSAVCTKFHPLKRNLKVNGRGKAFSCSVCKNGAMRKAYVRMYLRSHSGEASFSCSVCTKPFKVEEHLKRHMSTHAPLNGFSVKLRNGHQNNEETAERPFSCTECNARFRRLSNLNRHLTVHCEKC